MRIISLPSISTRISWRLSNIGSTSILGHDWHSGAFSVRGPFFYHAMISCTAFSA